MELSKIKFLEDGLPFPVTDFDAQGNFKPDTFAERGVVCKP